MFRALTYFCFGTPQASWVYLVEPVGNFVGDSMYWDRYSRTKLNPWTSLWRCQWCHLLFHVLLHDYYRWCLLCSGHWPRDECRRGALQHHSVTSSSTVLPSLFKSQLQFLVLCSFFANWLTKLQNDASASPLHPSGLSMNACYEKYSSAQNQERRLSVRTHHIYGRNIFDQSSLAKLMGVLMSANCVWIVTFSWIFAITASLMYISRRYLLRSSESPKRFHISLRINFWLSFGKE